MKEDTANNKAQKKFRAKEYGLNRSRKEFYLTDNEKVLMQDYLNKLRGRHEN
jgi:hypothetical protein